MAQSQLPRKAIAQNASSGTAVDKLKEIRMNLKDKFQHQDSEAKVDEIIGKYDQGNDHNQILQYQELNQMQDLRQDENNFDTNSNRSFENEDEEDIINNENRSDGASGNSPDSLRSSGSAGSDGSGDKGHYKFQFK